jgi:hypothetical protein
MFNLRNIVFLLVALVIIASSFYLILSSFESELDVEEEDYVVEYILDAPYLEDFRMEKNSEEIEPERDEDIEITEYAIEEEHETEENGIDFMSKEYEGMKYEIHGGSAFTYNGNKMATYSIVAGDLNEEQLTFLAKGIVNNIISQDDSINEITLLFLSEAGVHSVDVAQVVWNLDGLSVFMKN